MSYRKKRTIVFSLLPTLVFFTARFVYAWTPGQPLVPCTDTCDYQAFLLGVNNVTQFLLYLAILVAALLFAYAGFKYLFAAGSEGEIKKVHQIFWTAFWGLIFMASAWLVVRIIVQTLGSGPGAPNWTAIFGS